MMTERPEEYRVQVEWTGNKSGLVNVKGRAKIETGIPPGSDGTVQNYSPEEFVDFIMVHTRRKNADFIGVTSDGRPIYKIY